MISFFIDLKILISSFLKNLVIKINPEIDVNKSAVNILMVNVSGMINIKIIKNLSIKLVFLL